MSKVTALNEDIYLSERKIQLKDLGRCEIATGGDLVKTGRIIDGKEEYVKRYSQAFSSTGAIIKYGLDLNKVFMTDIKAYATNSTSTYFPLPNNRIDTNLQFEFFILNDEVRCLTNNFDRTGYTLYVELYFIYK